MADCGTRQNDVLRKFKLLLKKNVFKVSRKSQKKIISQLERIFKALRTSYIYIYIYNHYHYGYSCQ